MSTLSHFAASIGTTPTGFSALLTMVEMVSVFPTFLSACFADMSANFADVSRVSTATGHERDGGIADFGAVAVEPDAIHHHLYILFAKTGFKAGITGNGASLAGFDTILIRLGR